MYMNMSDELTFLERSQNIIDNLVKFINKYVHVYGDIHQDYIKRLHIYPCDVSIFHNTSRVVALYYNEKEKIITIDIETPKKKPTNIQLSKIANVEHFEDIIDISEALFDNYSTKKPQRTRPNINHKKMENLLIAYDVLRKNIAQKLIALCDTCPQNPNKISFLITDRYFVHHATMGDTKDIVGVVTTTENTNNLDNITFCFFDQVTAQYVDVSGKHMTISELVVFCNEIDTFLTKLKAYVQR